MGQAAWRWALLLCWMPILAWAGNAPLRMASLPAAPTVMGEAAPAPGASSASMAQALLDAPGSRTQWYQVSLAVDWNYASPPLLVVHGNMRARVTAYLPPDYRPHAESVFDATLDPTFSHRAVVLRLPPGLRAGQPIYLAAGDPGQSQPISVAIMDTASYRTADLDHVRLSTLFTSVQLSMVLVILCFWVVLRDRMFLYFIIYVGAQVVYCASVSGELFALPGAGLLGPMGFRTGQSMVLLAGTFSIWFILDFADLRYHAPRVSRWLGAFRWPYFALAVMVWLPFLRVERWLPNVANTLFIGSTILAIAAAWLAWRRGGRQAGFLLLSWWPMLAMIMLRVLQLIAGFPLPAWLEYGLPGSMAFAAIIITAGLADRTLQARHERDQATRMAQFDALTGVYNRRAIMERLHAAWTVAAPKPEPLAVLFLDIDHFKQVNDSRGHAAGDACLRAVTDAIRAELGEQDRTGRYGGEEFLVMLRGDSALLAPRVAGRIVARAAALSVEAGGHAIALTVSIGVAVRDEVVASAEALVERADAAQYRAKADGRNRVVVWRREAFAVAAV